MARRAGIDFDGTGPPAQPWGLDPRELEVLRLIAAGRSNREIGTVDQYQDHKRPRLQHLGQLLVHNRVEAAALALREGLADG